MPDETVRRSDLSLQQPLTAGIKAAIFTAYHFSSALISELIQHHGVCFSVLKIL